MSTDLPISRAVLAKALKISPQAIAKWDRVPSERVIEVSRATGWTVTPHQLRGDLYPHPDDGLPADLRRRSRRPKAAA